LSLDLNDASHPEGVEVVFREHPLADDCPDAI
jgi:hypothetical protein